jgi:tRNA A37 threonylcarbamoyladenosine modification protein TsaB
MVRTLLVDACVNGFSLGIAQDNLLVASSFAIRFEHLNQSVLDLGTFERILVNHGPGSFTGIRSSLSYVTAMSMLRYPAASLSVFAGYLADLDLEKSSYWIQPESKSRAAIFADNALKDFLLEKHIDSIPGDAEITLTRSWPEFENRRSVQSILSDWPEIALNWMALKADQMDYQLSAKIEPLYLRGSSAEEKKL